MTVKQIIKKLRTFDEDLALVACCPECNHEFELQGFTLVDEEGIEEVKAD